MAKNTKKSIFLHFFGQKICTYQKNVLPLHRQIKKSAKIVQFAINEKSRKKHRQFIKNAKSVQRYKK